MQDESENPFLNHAKHKYHKHRLKGDGEHLYEDAWYCTKCESGPHYNDEECPSCKPIPTAFVPTPLDINAEILNTFTKALEMIHKRNIP